ncbi:MAG: proline racemase family protein [Gammaproteobacteria bacterium]|nr:proline racemase family protein [Gammaproteobacteria bacterium]
MRVIDSHTEGEPTRVIIEGGPDLGAGSMRDRIARFADEFDHVRKMAILEPRGSDAIVGALLCEPTQDDCAAGVLFFNNRGYLGMCGHGSIGVAVTLAYLGKIGLGESKLETPVGVISVNLVDENTVTVENVSSYRYRRDVMVDVPKLGMVTGDIAWGGNWFFLCKESPFPINLDNERALTDAALKVQNALWNQGITGRDDGEIDHIEFFADAEASDADSRNFVLCPGGAYDRSPCGTGTSAKLACLADDGVLAPGTDWIQESIIGSRFVARYALNENGEIIPSITGRAFICADATLIQQGDDPFRNGIS